MMTALTKGFKKAKKSLQFVLKYRYFDQLTCFLCIFLVIQVKGVRHMMTKHMRQEEGAGEKADIG